MNHQQIDAMQVGETLWDDQIKGLLVMKFKSKTTFYIYYRTKWGASRKPSIGHYPTLRLSDARKIARNIKIQVALGEDPSGYWASRKEELSIRRVFERLEETHYLKIKSGKEASRLYWKHIDPVFGHEKPSLVKPNSVRDWHSKMAPTTANRALSIFSNIFDYAERYELIEMNHNPCKRVRRNVEKARSRYATSEELKALAVELKKDLVLEPIHSRFILALMFTGARPESLRSAKWEELKRFDLQGRQIGVLTFHGKSSTRTGEDEMVLLPHPILKLIDDFPPIGAYIFRKKTMKGYWKRLCERAGVKGLWMRDLRRTFATVGLNEEISRDAVGALLNHHSDQATRRYTKFQLVTKMKSVDKVADKLLEYVELSA